MNKEASVIFVALGLDLGHSSFKLLPRCVDQAVMGSEEGTSPKSSYFP